MKKSTQLYFYSWLVKTIAESDKGITLDIIQKRWIRTDVNDGIELTRHTFRRYKLDIADTFGIDIECDRKTNRYFIGNPQVLRSNSVQRWMLSALGVSHIITKSLAQQDRILLESIPVDENDLALMIEAMKTKHIISFLYKKYKDSIPTKRLIAPYCIKLFRQRWYVISYAPSSSIVFKAFAFDRMSDLCLTDAVYELPASFQAEDIFKDTFGIFFGEGEPPQRVLIRAYGEERFYMRDLPLHHSQEVKEEGDDYTDYQLYLRPYSDFISELLSKGNRIEVLYPKSIREKLREEHLKAAKRYEK